MPEGLIIMEWNERSGMEVLAQYPEDDDEIANPMTLMQVYSQHEYSREAGTITLTVGNVNILSYFSGPEIGKYIILILDESEDPDDHESTLIQSSQIILLNLKEEKYIQMLPSLFKTIAESISLTEEQALAAIYNDEMKRIIINRLRDECIADKAELVAWLKDKYRGSQVDTEALIIEMIKMGIIKESSIKGRRIPSIFLFLTNDLMIFRKAPKGLVKDPEKHGLSAIYIPKYIKEVAEFFEAYQPSEEDNLKVIKLMLDPRLHEILCLMRDKILTRMDLEKIKGIDSENLEETLLPLMENNLITVFESKSDIENFALISDFYVGRFFPYYAYNIIKDSYEQKSQVDLVLTEYLTILTAAYLDFNKS